MGSDLNLRHLAHLVAVCDNDLSISRAAKSLEVAQSVVSRNIQSLEQAFDALLFERQGRRLVAMTPLCVGLLDSIRDINVRIDCLQTIADQILKQPAAGEIRLACTHLQARYILPQVLTRLHKAHPGIRLTMHQGFPDEINQRLLNNYSDLGICSEQLPDEEVFTSIDAYDWQRVAVVPVGHPLARRPGRLTLQTLASEPTITYVPGITGRRSYDAVFAAADLTPNVVVAAADSDVIKQFTRAGHGIGVISEIAYEKGRDDDLVALELPKQFKRMSARLTHRKDRLLSKSQRLFVGLFKKVARGLAG